MKVQRKYKSLSDEFPCKRFRFLRNGSRTCDLNPSAKAEDPSEEGVTDCYGNVYIGRFFINRVNSSIESYYDNLNNKRKEKCEGNELSITKEEFKKYFNGKICYIAGFIYGINENTNSFFSKIMTDNINNLLKDKEFDFVLMDLNFEED